MSTDKPARDDIYPTIDAIREGYAIMIRDGLAEHDDGLVPLEDLNPADYLETEPEEDPVVPLERHPFGSEMRGTFVRRIDEAHECNDTADEDT